MAQSLKSDTTEDSGKIHLDRVSQLKMVGGVIALLERARDDATASQLKDVEMIVTSALNLVFSTYYLHLRGEYLEKDNTWEVDNSAG